MSDIVILNTDAYININLLHLLLVKRRTFSVLTAQLDESLIR